MTIKTRIAQLWTGIGQRIIIGKGVKQAIPEAGVRSLAANCQTPGANPSALLLSIRQNPDIPADIYPVMAKISPQEMAPALVMLSCANQLPLADLEGTFQGASLTFKCCGNSYEATARQLWPRSATLRSVPQSVLLFPQSLITWLNKHKAAIAAELGGRSHSVSYLVQALNANGKITPEERFFRLASAYDLYERSTTLQSAPQTITSDPIRLIAWVKQNKTEIEAEAGSDNLALATLINALISAGAVSDEQKYIRLAGAADLYERSATLRAVPAAILKDPVETVNWLKDQRAQIEQEASEGDLSIGYLLEALIAAKKAPLEQRFTRMASALELYLRSQILQSIPAQILDNPVKFINWLFVQRPAIEQEAGKGDKLALVTLLHSLEASRVIPLREALRQLAGAREIYETSSILKSIPKKILKDPIEVIDWLYKNRNAICQETNRQSLAIITLLHALQAAGLIPLEQTYERLASGRDFYDRSPTLQAVPANITNNPLDLADWLTANRIAICREASQKTSISLTTIMEALIAAKRVALTTNGQRIVSARDFYERTPILHAGPKTFSSIEEIILFIDQRRNQLVSIKDREQPPENPSRVSFIYVVDALTSARRIGPTIKVQKLRFEAAAADYARRKQAFITQKIIAAVQAYHQTLLPPEQSNFNPSLDQRWTINIDRKGFISLDGTKQLSGRYIRTILKWALILYGYKAAQSAIIII